MPTYEYRCASCNHKFEVFQSIKDDPVEECPSCAGKVNRLPGGGTGLIFKGSGFYITDYKNKKAAADSGDGKESGKKETGSPKEGGKTSEAKTEKKSAE